MICCQTMTTLRLITVANYRVLREESPIDPQWQLFEGKKGWENIKTSIEITLVFIDNRDAYKLASTFSAELTAKAPPSSIKA